MVKNYGIMSGHKRKKMAMDNQLSPQQKQAVIISTIGALITIAGAIWWAVSIYQSMH